MRGPGSPARCAVPYLALPRTRPLCCGRHAMTMRRRTASAVALVVGAAALASAWPAQASTWLPGVSVSDDASACTSVDAERRGRRRRRRDGGLAWGAARPFGIRRRQTASRDRRSAGLRPVQAVGAGRRPTSSPIPTARSPSPGRSGRTERRRATPPAGACAFPPAGGDPPRPRHLRRRTAADVRRGQGTSLGVVRTSPPDADVAIECWATTRDARDLLLVATGRRADLHLEGSGVPFLTEETRGRESPASRPYLA